jgi:hypothetical protein
MNTQEILEKYFKEERTLYFQSSDAHQQIEGDTYLRYEKTGKIEVWFGGNNGEMCLCATTDPGKLESIIKAMVF